jgi:hypothetical protein
MFNEKEGDDLMNNRSFQYYDNSRSSIVKIIKFLT